MEEAAPTTSPGLSVPADKAGGTRRVQQLADALLPLVAGFLFFVVNANFNWRTTMFQADRDEGYALIQSLLLDRGYALYSEIWSDQLPGYTYLVWAFTQVFGETPEVARSLTSLLVAGALASLYWLIRPKWPGWGGHLAGLLGCAALVCTEDFIRYSCAAMIGLPSLALALMAWVMLDRSRGRATWNATAGLLLALSLAVKPLSAPAALPLVLFALTRSVLTEGTWGRRWRALAPLAAALSLGLLAAFLPMVLTPDGDTFWQVHRLDSADNWAGWAVTKGFLKQDAWLLAPAVVSGGVLLARKGATGTVGLAWSLLSLLALAHYSPVWSHHRYVLLIPAAAVFGLGLAELGSWVQSTQCWRARLLPVVILVLVGSTAFLLWPPERGQQLARYYTKEATPSSAARTLEKLSRLAPEARTMTTFQQMQAYRLGLTVPPQLAVTSRKRFHSGELDAEKVAHLALQADSDIVCFDGRWPRAAASRVQRAIRSTHRRVLSSRSQGEFYVRRTLLVEDRD